MGYVVERVPVPPQARTTRANPVATQMRQLEPGESFLVPFDDPHWRAALVGNENQRGARHFFVVMEAGGRRVFRDR